ncbi:MAG: hypothetical protein ACXU86_10805 [Archangium sp.]
MPEENNSSASPKPKKKSGRSWLRDLAFFGIGFATGSVTTIGVGLATDKVQPEDLGPIGNVLSHKAAAPSQ